MFHPVVTLDFWKTVWRFQLLQLPPHTWKGWLILGPAFPKSGPQLGASQHQLGLTLNMQIPGAQPPASGSLGEKPTSLHFNMVSHPQTSVRSAGSETGDDPKTHCHWARAPLPQNTTSRSFSVRLQQGFLKTQGCGNCRRLWKVGANYKAVFAWFWKQGKFWMRFRFRDKFLKFSSSSTPCSEIMSS